MLGIKGYFDGISDMGCFLDVKTQNVVNDYQALGDEVSLVLWKYSIVLFVMSTVTFFPSLYLFLRVKKRVI